MDTAAKQIEKLAASIEEARDTIREMHSVRAGMLDVVKTHRKTIRETVADEVVRSVRELEAEARARMIAGVERVVDELGRELRGRLGLKT